MTADQEKPARILSVMLARQHGPLLAVLRGLEAMLGGSPPAQGDLERRLNGVADTLAAHIAEEESGDLFLRIPKAFDEMKKELDALRAEHEPFVETLRQLAVDTRGAETVLIHTDLSIRIRSVIAALRQHEARESAVLQKIGDD